MLQMFILMSKKIVQKYCLSKPVILVNNLSPGNQSLKDWYQNLMNWPIAYRVMEEIF